MNPFPSDFGEPSRLRLLIDHFSLIHFSLIEDPREPHRVAFPMAELLRLAVCGTIADYDAIAVWGGNASCVSAAFPAVLSWHPLGTLADDYDEPGQPGAVFGTAIA